MKVFFRLFKMYLISVLNFKNLKEQIKKRKKKKSGETVVKNSTFKIIGVVFLVLLLMAEFLILFGLFAYSLYSGTKAINNMSLLFEMSIALISIFTLFFGFMIVSSTYYIGDIEEHLLSMPINPKTLLGSKFASNSVNSIIGSFSFFVIIMIIYGINEHPPIPFYIWGTVISLLIPLPMLAFAYLINILVMKFTKVFKNKSLIMAINASLGILFAIGFNVLIQSNNGDLGKMGPAIATRATAFAEYGKFYPITKLAGKILVEPTALINFLYIGIFLIACLILPVLVIFFMSKAYSESLVGFNEKKVKRLESSDISSFIGKKIKKSNVFLTFVKREFNTMNRNPIFLINGPLSIIVMPLLMIIIFISKGHSLSDIPDNILNFMQSSIGAVAVGLATAFLGTTANVAQTSISRDAKFIPMLQSLPVDIVKYMYAKFFHSMIFVILAIAINIGFCSYIFKLNLSNIIFACLVSLSFSALLNLIGLFLDTIRPKLHWDNPVAAMKQNSNVLLDMLSNLIILLVTGVVVVLSRNSYWWVQFIYFVCIPTAIFTILLKPYGIYAEKKINELEI